MKRSILKIICKGSKNIQRVGSSVAQSGKKCENSVHKNF